MTFNDNPVNPVIRPIPVNYQHPTTQVLLSLVIAEAGFGDVFSASSPYPTLPDFYKEAIENNCDGLTHGKVEMGYDPATDTYVVTMHCKED